MALLAARFDVLLPHRFSPTQDSQFAARASRIRGLARLSLSAFQHRTLGSCRCPAAAPRAIRFRLRPLLHLAISRSHLPFLNPELARFCSARLLSSALLRRCAHGRHPFALCHAPMKTHCFGILIWSLVAFALYTVLTGIGWAPVVSRHETALTTICRVLSGVLAAPFLWIPPQSLLDGLPAFVLMSIFWGSVFYCLYAVLRRFQRSRNA